MYTSLFAVVLLFVWFIVKGGVKSKTKSEASPEDTPSSSTDTDHASSEFVGTDLSETVSESESRTSEDVTEQEISEGGEPSADAAIEQAPVEAEPSASTEVEQVPVEVDPSADAEVEQAPVETDSSANAKVEQTPVEVEPSADVEVEQAPAEVDSSADAEVEQAPVEVDFSADAEVEQAPVEGNCALEFDGRRNYIAIENLSYSSKGEIRAITVEAWIKTSKRSEGIIASWDRSEYWRLAIGNSVRQPPRRVYWATTNEARQIDDFVGRIVVADGDWHFITVVYEAETGMKRIYVDGKLDRTKKAHNGQNLGTGVTRYGFIGVGSEATTVDGKKAPLFYFQGQIDEVRIWDHVRSEDEIKANMQRQFVGHEDGLLSYWRFNEGTGDTVSDQSGNRNDGKIYGAQWVESDAPVAE